jgi:NAD-dependent dihydropyrimidine dehydrogenase PreA subunit
MACVDFCPHDVFEIRENEFPKLIVKNPANCVVFCRICSKTCGPDAIEFPDRNKTAAHIKDVRKGDV